MRDNIVKENISKAFVGLLMAKNRLKIHKPDSDDGVDLTVGTVECLLRADGTKTYIDSNKRLDIQLKCTTEKDVKKMANDNYRYYLRVKNYEDLVHRRQLKKKYTELILIVFVLPDSEVDWMDIVDDQIMLKRHAFWFYPSEEDTLDVTANKKKDDHIGIEIKSINKLNLDFKSIFQSFCDA